MTKAVFGAVAVLLVVALCQVAVTESVTCVFTELEPCFLPLMVDVPPSDECCAKFKEQEPCLCGYIKDPVYAEFIKSPLAPKVEQTCAIPAPQCS
ncbi:hypothetical protein LguiA_014137 [Lonicera macranthoides]